MEKARLIIDEPAEGAWNMSVDQALLETANETGKITLRFYRWAEPTLSLGYFQNHEDRRLHVPSTDCPLVRRKTGGGAILHHHELTYSLCVPSENRWASRNSDLYSIVHLVIIEFLKSMGVVSHLHQDVTTKNPEVDDAKMKHPLPKINPKAFMCFERRSPGDIVLDGHKVVGSAQRRSKNALLQHGSILLKSSNCAPSLPGIQNLNDDFSHDGLIEAVSNGIFSHLKANFIQEALNSTEIESTKGVYSSHFGNSEWNFRR